MRDIKVLNAMEVSDLLLECEDRIYSNKLKLENSISLFKGLSGYIVYSALMYEYKKEEKYLKEISDAIHSCINKIETEESVMANYCNGYCGFGWALNFLYKKGIVGEEVLPILEQIDELCVESLLSMGRDGHFDFLHGALGFLHYLIDRGVTMKFESEINEFIGIVQNKAERHENGIRLMCHSSFVPYEHRGQEVEVLGLAHGSSSAIVIFSKLVSSGFNAPGLTHFIDGLVKNILSNRYDDTTNSIYPGVVTNRSDKHEGNISWCYGEVGIAFALKRANRLLENKYEKEFLEILQKEIELTTSIEHNHIDSCLCHGFIGNALLYFRLGVEYPEAGLNRATEYWLKRGLKNYKDNSNWFLFKKLRDDGNGNLYVELDNQIYDLLDGLIGTTLALLTITKNVEADWAELILI